MTGYLSQVAWRKANHDELNYDHEICLVDDIFKAELGLTRQNLLTYIKSCRLMTLNTVIYSNH